MIPVNQLHSLTYYIAAKQLTAFPSPDEWNQYAVLANMDLYNYYQDEREKMLLSVKSGSEIYVPEVLSTYVVNEYLMSPCTQTPSIPLNLAYSIAYKTPVNSINSTIKKVDYNKLETYLNSTIDAPTASNPIYVELSDNFMVYPLITNPTFLSYYRYPVAPMWNYTVVNGAPTYTSVGSVDFEWEQSEIWRLTTRILGYMGISIRDGELMQYSEQMKNEAS